MEATRKCLGAFCRLLLGVLCVAAVCQSSLDSYVVSFGQQDQTLLDSKHPDTAVRQAAARAERSSAADTADFEFVPRNYTKCYGQRQTIQDAIKGGKRLETTYVFRDETKRGLSMAWAGKDDDGRVMVVLMATSGITQESTLWRSTDFGRTWTNINSKVGDRAFRNSDGLMRNAHNPKWLYLISYEDYIYISEDGGESWTLVALPGIVKDQLIFHPDERYKDHVMIITAENKLIMTKNNFETIKTVQNGLVHKAHWGTEDSKSATQIFMLFGDEQQSLFPSFWNGYELKQMSVESENYTWKTVRENVADFGIQGDFMYASVYKDNHTVMDSERLMIVSDDAEHWNEAQLPTITSDQFFSVLDMSEHHIFMHVDSPGDTGYGTLYTSGSKGILFSESLQRHLYPNFYRVTDFYKVSSMRGTYITNWLQSRDNTIHSVITFNLGGTWQPLAKPEDVVCKEEEEECSLQVHNSYSIHRGVRAHPPVSIEQAVGLILVSANPAKNLQTTDPDVFISSDGGYSWRKALDGPHTYVIADSGGLIVAVSLKDPNPKELKFSTDEGRCWHVYQFTNETIHHTGLLTEPGGKSMMVALWGYRVSNREWTVTVIDFADVITDYCTASDYESWMPHEIMKKDDSSRQGCLLGHKTVFQRLKHDSWCRNGYYYVPEQTDRVCPCTIDDFECDYGYYRPMGQEKCVKEPNFFGPEIDVCLLGHREKVITQGYRKIPGDVCDEAEGVRPNGTLVNLTSVCSKLTLPPPEETEVGKENEQEEDVNNTLIWAYATPNYTEIVEIIVVETAEEQEEDGSYTELREHRDPANTYIVGNNAQHSQNHCLEFWTVLMIYPLIIFLGGWNIL